MNPILNAAPRWFPDRCESVHLWHGCTETDRASIEKNGIQLKHSRPSLDFGKGFYLTSSRRQADYWAYQQYVRKFGNGNFPVVLRFSVSRKLIAECFTLHFTSGDFENEDFWSFVQHCRSRGNGREIPHHHGPVKENGRNMYDVVIGPVAANWKQRVAMQGYDKVSFHTRKALDILNISLGVNGSYDYLRVQTPKEIL